MKRRRITVLTGVAITAAMILAGCGSDDSSDQDGSSGSNSGADVAAAEAFIADYVGQPSEFPTDDKLDALPEPGTEVVFVDSGTAIGEIQWGLVQAPAAEMGLDITRVKAGTDAASVSAAFDSIVSMKPDGVLIASVNPVLYASQLEELRGQGATVVASAISDGDKYGFGPVTYGDAEVARAGALMGAWTIARSEGEATSIALYTVPELAFSDPEIAAAEAKIKELCPDCDTRIVPIPVAQLAANAAQLVVSDIQAHPDTDAAIFATDEIAIGLPSALEVAGLDLTTVGGAGAPANLQQIKDGDEDAALAVDLMGQAWQLVDQYARERAGQELTGASARGELVKQFLTQEDITFDPNLGWTGYPDMPERFAELWGTAGAS